MRPVVQRRKVFTFQDRSKTASPVASLPTVR
jgi:hypothetical protein